MPKRKKMPQNKVEYFRAKAMNAEKRSEQVNAFFASQNAEGWRFVAVLDDNFYIFERVE